MNTSYRLGILPSSSSPKANSLPCFHRRMPPQTNRFRKTFYNRSPNGEFDDRAQVLGDPKMTVIGFTKRRLGNQHELGGPDYRVIAGSGKAYSMSTSQGNGLRYHCWSSAAARFRLMPSRRSPQHRTYRTRRLSDRRRETTREQGHHR